MPSPFPCSPVIRECSWRNTWREKKRILMSKLSKSLHLKLGSFCILISLTTYKKSLDRHKLKTLYLKNQFSIHSTEKPFLWNFKNAGIELDINKFNMSIWNGTFLSWNRDSWIRSNEAIISKYNNYKNGSIIPELQNQITKPSYGLWHYKPSY